jgi:hypothetical protein
MPKVEAASPVAGDANSENEEGGSTAEGEDGKKVVEGKKKKKERIGFRERKVSVVDSDRLLVGFVVHRVERSFLEVAFLSRADY